jgi:hypothetical protein
MSHPIWDHFCLPISLTHKVYDDAVQCVLVEETSSPVVNE